MVNRSRLRQSSTGRRARPAHRSTRAARGRNGAVIRTRLVGDLNAVPLVAGVGAEIALVERGRDDGPMQPVSARSSVR
ncbi:MAG: hypothetical protein M0014_11665 [Actinomycetota bacterium]|nr:hypothetical protein [Actinomycetota bacterium]